MDLKQNFEFRRTPEWIKYTHERYLPLEEIRHRLRMSNNSKWKELETSFLAMRKTQSVLIDIKSLNQKFWFVEADCIRQKLADVLKIGTEIYERVHSAHFVEKEFFSDASIEEALSSAIYEGANTTRAKAKQFLTEKEKPTDKAEQMLLNNHHSSEWIKKNCFREIDINVILHIHEIVTRKTLDEELIDYSGKFRDDEVFVGDHRGVDHNLINKALIEAIDESLANMRYIHPIIQGVVLHYLLAYIHPFFDGNGRTARTLFYFQAMKHDFKFVELLSISAHLKEHGGRYEKSFKNAVLHQGDMTFFIDFALDSMLSAMKVVDAKVTFLQKIWQLKKIENLNNEQILLLQKLALNKFRTVTIKEFSEEIQRTHEMARIELKKLVEKGLLIEEKRGRTLYFRCPIKKLRERFTSTKL